MGGASIGCHANTGVSNASPPAPRPASVADSVAPTSRVDVEFALQAGEDELSLLAGPRTRVWRFSGQIQHGPQGALVQNDASYLGPTIRVEQGGRMRVHLKNALGEATIVHWHGLDVDAKSDGHPSYAIAAGGQYSYDFEVRNRAGTYWYHAHPDGRTGAQVYQGLAGLLIVSDAEERRLGLPDGDRELLCVLQDRTFDEGNQLLYTPSAMSGFLGEQVLVNGQLPRTLELPSGPHRLRILNGSNSRIYDLSWSDGSKLTVLGTDGGLLEVPFEREHLVLAPGQRLDVWADFGHGPGPDVWLESRPFEDPGTMMGMGMHGGMRRGRAVPVENGAPLRIQRFVARGNGRSARPPATLSTSVDRRSLETAKGVAAKTFPIGMRGMRWLLNDAPFELRGVAANERVKLGAVEDWQFVNPGGPMSMAHPIHVHGSQFRIMEREAGSGSTALRSGILDDGWQDTVLVLPGDRVRIRKRFANYPGLFLYHCHNLEHEDMGMMRNFLVETS